MCKLRYKILPFFLLLAILLFSQKNNPSPLLNELSETIKILESGDYETSLKSFNQILSKAKATNNKEIIVQTVLNKGLLYYRLNDLEKALNLYFEALELSNEYKQTQLFNSIYNNIGIVYSINDNYEKAYEYFQKALQVSQQRNDTIRVGINYVNLANLNVDFNYYKKAHEYLNEAEKIFLKYKQIHFLAPLYSIEGNIYFKEQRYKLSKLSHQKGLSYLKKHTDLFYEADFNTQLAKSFLELDNIDSALFHLEHALDVSKDVKNKDLLIQVTELLGQTYKQAGKTKEALRYYQEAIALKDSLLIEKSQKWVSESQMRYEFGKKEQEISFLERKNKLYLIIGLLVFVTILITAFFIIYSLRNRNIKTKQRNAILKQEKELHQLELQKSEAENKCLVEEMRANEEISHMKQEKLKQEIEHKNRELASNALHVVNKNNILSEIKDSLKTIECENQNEISNKLRSISRLIDSNMTLDNDWESFKLHFEEVHGEFFKKLAASHDDLSQGDLRLCAYLLINLNPKEIAQILNISPDSVRKRKQRLREKLALNKDHDLVEYLHSFKL